jgi:hypothetical protein
MCNVWVGGMVYSVHKTKSDSASAEINEKTNDKCNMSSTNIYNSLRSVVLQGVRWFTTGVPREMENISKGPTFGDFVTIRTEASMQDATVARLQSTRVQTPYLPTLFNAMYCVRVSLWTVTVFLRNTKEIGSWATTLYLHRLMTWSACPSGLAGSRL